MVHQINMFIHILAGTIGLVIGLIPYFSEKGGKVHRKYGRFFLYLMVITVVTALIGVVFFRSRPFLTVVTMLSAYTSFGGYRALKYRTGALQIKDLAFTLVTLGCALYFVLAPQDGNVIWHASVVYYLLGWLFLLTCYDIVRYFGGFKYKNNWLFEHVIKTNSAYVALLSAATGTVLADWQPYSQIIPSIVGTVLLVVILFYFLYKRPKSV